MKPGGKKHQLAMGLLPDAWRHCRRMAGSKSRVSGVRPSRVRQRRQAGNALVNPHRSPVIPLLRPGTGALRGSVKLCLLLLAIGLLAGASLRAAGLSGADVTNRVPPVLSLAIRCTNEVLQAGDEIPIEFIITNQGTNDYKYENRNYDRSGRMWEFKLTARTEAGVEVADPRSKGGGGMMGGLFGYAVLKPGQSLERVIPLNLWALVTEPGRYGVTGVYVADNPEATSLTSTPITVTVRPRTAAEMDDYIGGLTNALAARLRGGSSPDGNSRWAALGTEELVRKLMYTGSSNMVPALLPLTGAPGNGGFWAWHALLEYVPQSPEIRQAIIQTALGRAPGALGSLASLLIAYGGSADEVKPLIERSLAADRPSDWADGARLARHFGDDTFVPRLAAIANTPGGVGRIEAIEALTADRTDEGVRTLLQLMRDADPALCWRLAAALQYAFQPRPGAASQPLRKEDFAALDFQPLIDRLLASTNYSDQVMGQAIQRQFVISPKAP